MKSIQRFLGRFLIGLFVCFLVFFVANIAGLTIYLRVLYDTHEGDEDFSPTWAVRDTVEGLTKQDGEYQLAPSVVEELLAHSAWAMLLDDNGDVIWSMDLPEEIPLSYTPRDVAGFTRYYLQDYPVFCWEHPDGLVVTGYPKGSYMRYTLNFAEQDARTIFECVLLFLVGNVLVAILIYAFLCWWTVRPVRPILHGLSCLARGEPVQLAERGSLREVAAGINAASGELQRRDDALRKKDEARANWIAGISHDIRTPLSVILGYAGELQDDPALPAAGAGAGRGDLPAGGPPARPGQRPEPGVPPGIRHAAPGMPMAAPGKARPPRRDRFYERDAGKSLRDRTGGGGRIHPLAGGRAVAFCAR